MSWDHNNEANPARFGPGHRPSAQLIGAGWISRCGCANPACDRGRDACQYVTREDALDASHTNLTLCEHGDPT